MAYRTYYNPSSNDYLTVDYDEPTQAAWGKEQGLIDATQPLDWTKQVPGWQKGWVLNPGSSPQWTNPFPTQTQPIATQTQQNIGGTNMSDGLPVTRPLAEADAFAAYLKQHGLGGYGYSPAEQWQQEQFNPMYATNLASNYLAQIGKRPTTAWGSYMGSDPMASRAGAVSAIQEGAELSGQEQVGMIDTLGADDFRRLVFNALAATVGPDLAQRMVGRLGGLQVQYSAETGGAGKTFLTYLRQKYGL